MRPQFGSCPKSAVFTSIEFAIRRAARSACWGFAAPTTSTVTSLVAPSPSRASICDNCVATSSSAASNLAAPALLALRIAAFPATPLAITTTVSLVEPSPSIVTQLYVWSATRLSAPRKNAGDTFASVVMNESIVAMLGSIIPEPLAMPEIVTCLRFTTTVVLAYLAKVSVVRIASAARLKPLALSSFCASTAPARIFAIGRGSPITPVDETRTSSALQPMALPAAAAMAAASRRPRSPMAVFEQPLLATIARARPAAARGRDHSTGAPTMVDFVKTPATEAGSSLTIIAKSRSDSLTPQ